ncbi:MAG: phage portal protein [Caulobacterales bacterium]|nr:phage portal protein [Caulobacterales bacterium]
MARSTPGYRPMVFTDAEPRALSSPVGPPRDPVIAEWLGQYAATASGVNVTPDNARRCAEVDACIGLIEDTIATVPLDFFRRVSDDERQPAADHPLHALLHDAPNGWQTSAEFRQMMEGWRNTHANAYARVVSGPRGPIALEPEHPASMLPFRSGDGVAYRWTPLDGSAPRTLLQHEVLHLRGGPPKRGNLALAESKVERHREDIGMLQASGEYLARFFSNNATPKAAITIPSEISNEAAARLRDTWEGRHRGLENQHRIAILEGGLDIKALGLTNDEAQVAEVHTLAVAKVARIFGVPLHLIGETSANTSWGTGIEQQSIGFVTYYMRPKFVVWEQALNRTLMSGAMRQAYYFEFNIDGLLRGDFKTRMEGYALLAQWGVMTINEIRKLMNLPPVDGGDERLHPLNMAPASRIMDVLLRTPPGQTQRDQADLATRFLQQLIDASGARIQLAA